jgi:hypothetical protein
VRCCGVTFIFCWVFFKWNGTHAMSIFYVTLCSIFVKCKHSDGFPIWTNYILCIWQQLYLICVYASSG